MHLCWVLKICGIFLLNYICTAEKNSIDFNIFILFTYGILVPGGAKRINRFERVEICPQERVVWMGKNNGIWRKCSNVICIVDYALVFYQLRLSIIGFVVSSMDFYVVKSRLISRANLFAELMSLFSPTNGSSFQSFLFLCANKVPPIWEVFSIYGKIISGKILI